LVSCSCISVSDNGYHSPVADDDCVPVADFRESLRVWSAATAASALLMRTMAAAV